MSRAISDALKAHLAGNLTTLATCWKVTRTDDQVFAFTDHDVDIVFEGVTYEASGGMLPSAIKQDRTAVPDGMEVTAVLDSDRISERDLLAGLFDYASIDIFIVNWADLTMGKLIKAGGWKLGQVKAGDLTFSAEITSKLTRLSQTGMEVYSKTCRATLGDARCGVDMDLPANRVTGSVTAVVTIVDPLAGNRPDRKRFYDTSRTETEVSMFAGGILIWTDSGCPNNGISCVVRTWDPATGLIELEKDLPDEITVGDAFDLKKACSKTCDICLSRFDNIENFRGEPDVPVSGSLPFGPRTMYPDQDPWVRGI